MSHKASSKHGVVELTGAALDAENARQAQGLIDQAAREVAEANAEIDRQLEANDRKIVRALAEGDTDRINAHKAAQAALRANKQ